MKDRQILITVVVAIAMMTCDRQPDVAKISYYRPSWTSEFRDSCLIPDADTTGWKTIDSRSVSFKVPPEYVKGPGIPIDVEGVDLVYGERKLGFCAQCAPFVANAAQWIRCKRFIGGHPAYIVASRGPIVDGKYFAGASWVNGEGYFVFGGTSPDFEGQQIALAALSTVQFKVDLGDVRSKATSSRN